MTTNPIENAGLLPHLPGYIEQLGIPDTLEKAIAERNAWVESAAMFSRNEDYYCDLLDQIAAHLGIDAFTADDGSVYDSPVRAKLPDLVKARTPGVHPEQPVGEVEPFGYWVEHVLAEPVFLRPPAYIPDGVNYKSTPLYRHPPATPPLAAPAGVDEVERLREVIKHCRAQFDFYAREHRSAKKFAKAETNQQFADICSDALKAVLPSTDAIAIRAGALKEAAKVAREVGKVQTAGWERNPGGANSGATASWNTSLSISEAILALSEQVAGEVVDPRTAILREVRDRLKQFHDQCTHTRICSSDYIKGFRNGFTAADFMVLDMINAALAQHPAPSPEASS